MEHLDAFIERIVAEATVTNLVLIALLIMSVRANVFQFKRLDQANTKIQDLATDFVSTAEALAGARRSAGDPGGVAAHE